MMLGRETPMYTKYFFVDNSGHRKTIEAICEGLPKFDIVTALALIVEAINSVDGSALMVPSQEEEVLWIFDFVGQQEADGFKALFTPVDVVPKKQVVGIRGESTVLKQTQEIIVLTMNIYHNLDGSFQF
jgi:hypothetical protein